VEQKIAIYTVTQKYNNNYRSISESLCLKERTDLANTTSRGNEFHKSIMRLLKKCLLTSREQYGLTRLKLWPLVLDCWKLFNRLISIRPWSIYTPVKGHSSKDGSPDTCNLSEYGILFKPDRHLVKWCWTCSILAIKWLNRGVQTGVQYYKRGLTYVQKAFSIILYGISWMKHFSITLARQTRQDLGLFGQTPPTNSPTFWISISSWFFLTFFLHKCPLQNYRRATLNSGKWNRERK